MNCLGVRAARARVALVLRQCIRNVPAVSLVFPTFDDSGSLGNPLRQGVYPLGSMVPWFHPR